MIRFLPIALAALLVSSPCARAACEAPTQRAELALKVEQAHQAFRQLDRVGFAAARDELLVGLPCLGEPLQPADAAAIHGLMALSAFLDKDDGQSVANLHAAVRTDPGFDLPHDLFPDGHPLRLHLQVARSLQPGVLRPLPQPSEGAVSVDGAPAEAAPGDRPSVLQWSVSDLEVRDTSYLAVGGTMPDWGPIPVSDQAGARRRPWAVLAAAGAAAIAAGGLCGLAADRHAHFVDSSTPYEQLPGLQRQANGATIAAAGSGTLAVSLGVVAVLRW
jgi:hypothetical protein